MRIAVTGGRDYANQARVDEALGAVHADSAITLLIHGRCTVIGDAGDPVFQGFDRLADNWARSRGIPVMEFPADWENIGTRPCSIGVNRAGRPYNKLAGFNRNIAMLEQGEPELLIVGPGGRGTAHCHAHALKRGIPSLEVHD